MSNAFSGVGAELRKFDGSNFVQIAEVKSISGPGMSREMIDVTSLDSTGGYREFIPSFRDGGNVTFALNFTHTEYQKLFTDYSADTIKDFELVLPDSASGYSTFEFSAYVAEIPIEVTFDDAVMCNVTLKISGPVAFNAGSGSGGS